MSLLALQTGAPGGPELVVLLVSVGLPLIVSYLVYRSAKRRGSRHALAWGVGAFFGSVVVWILYYVVRDEVGPGRG